MVKTTQTQNDPEENKKRLQEIAEMRFGALSDDEILHFLAERKRLFERKQEYEKKQKEEAIRLEQEKEEAENLKKVEEKKAIIVQKIDELNKSISPDKRDDDLLNLIAQRKILEQEMEALEKKIVPKEEKSASVIHPPLQTARETSLEQDAPEKELPTVISEEKKRVVLDEKTAEATLNTERKIKVSVGDDRGMEKINDDGIEENSEFQTYLNQLRGNVGSLGEFLQGMPTSARKNKAFMLKVAEIDPAYAMHYADNETLKHDEDFNLRIASLDNPRNSGNPLVEMLPEARTSKVLLAAVKRDYRNIRFIQPAMADYDEILTRAKESVLEKVKNLKEAVDIMAIVPKVLQQDKQFMLQVNEMIEPKKER